MGNSANLKRRNIVSFRIVFILIIALCLSLTYKLFATAIRLEQNIECYSTLIINGTMLKHAKGFSSGISSSNSA